MQGYINTANNLSQPLSVETAINDYIAAGFSLIPIPAINGKPVKGPRTKGWNLPKDQNNPNGYSNDPDDLIRRTSKPNSNLGLALEPSRVVSIDLDNLDLAREALALADIDLDALMDSPSAVKINGREGRGKLLYRVPEGFNCCTVTLKFGKRGEERTIFELRFKAETGGTHQDVLPPSLHPLTGRPYELQGDIFNIPMLPEPLVSLWTYWELWKPVMLTLDPAYVESIPKATPSKPADEEWEINPIEEFNKNHSIHELLAAGGYIRKGQRYLRPGSESSEPGITFLDEQHIFSHGGDALADGHKHDAFDVYRLLSCGGDWKQALNWDPEITQRNREAWTRSRESTEDQEIPKETQLETVLARFNAQYAVVLHGASAVIVTINEQGEYEFYKENDLRKIHRGELVALKTKEGTKLKEAFTWWLSNKERRQHGKMIFKPSRTFYRPTFPAAARTPTLNLWRGLRIEPKPGSCDQIEEHLFDVWAAGDSARYEYILRWLAAKFQRLGQKVRTCLVFQGTQGDGKNTIWELVLVPILGSGARLITNCQHVTGRFNAALRGTVLVLLNEAFWGGSHDYEGILKGLTTDPTFMLEQKGIDPCEIPNFLDLIMFTNSPWPVRVGPGDRRYYITQTSPIHKGDTSYFRKLRESITDEVRAAFLHMLLELDLSDFDPEAFPDEHDLKLHAKICSLEPHERFIVEFVREMSFGSKEPNDFATFPSLIRAGKPGESYASSDLEWSTKGINLDKEALYGLYLDYIKTRSLGRAAANNAFFRSFWKMLGAAARTKRPWDADSGQWEPRVIELSSRPVCEKALFNFLKTGTSAL